MRLEFRWSRVDDVAAGSITRLSGRRLSIDLDGLRADLAGDARLARVEIDLARPGERCRIGRVLDVIAPRAKPDGRDFPGVLTPLARVGDGPTLALDGVAVVITDQQATSTGALAVIDMDGPGAELSRFAHTHNVVISAWAAPESARPSTWPPCDWPG
jgi:glycine reductase complex component B subunit alpha and beta